MMYRKLIPHGLKYLLKKELVARYGSSISGFAWILIKPLVMLSIYAIVFSEIFKIRWNYQVSNTFEFAILIYSGLFIVNFFNESIIKATNIVSDNSQIIKNVNIHFFVFNFVSQIILTIELMINFVLIFIITYLLEMLQLNINFIASICSLIILVIISFTFANIVSVISFIYPFMKQAISFVCMSLIFLSPVFYPLEVVPEKFILIIKINPLTTVIENFRAFMNINHSYDINLIIMIILLAITSLIINFFGKKYFKKIISNEI
jgi:lipopolysaccharide transport system permease protein